MKKSSVCLLAIITAVCFGGLITAPVVSYGAPHTSFNPLRKRKIENFARISTNDIRALEKSPFEIPEFLRPAVNFWTSIYTLYNSDQVVLHDKEYLQIIYEVVGFSDIYDKRISYRKKKRLRRKRIETARKKIRTVLKKLSRKKTDPAKLTGLEKKIYEQFSGIEEKDKFKSAVKRVRAQIGHRRSFRQGLIDSGLFMAEMEIIFSSYGLPKELTRLPFVESFFNTKAISKVGASGIWQFIRSTGRLFLTINNIIDERNDPIKATHAAAKLLKGNYDQLGSWPLAVTAYNHGRLGVSRAVKETGSNNLGDIIENYKRRRFGFASRNFYAEFLAALNIYQNYTRHFNSTPIEDPFEFDFVKLANFVSARSLAKHCNLSPEIIHEYNPELKISVISSQQYLPRGYELKIPQGMKEDFLKKYSGMPARLKMTAQKTLDRHRVRRGQTLSQIARKYRVRIADIVALNNLPSKHFIRSGQMLKLPVNSSKKSKKTATSTKKAIKTAGKTAKKKAVLAKVNTKLKQKPVRKKITGKKTAYSTILSSASEKDISVSSGTMSIKKVLGTPKMISYFSRLRKNTAVYEPVVNVIDYPITGDTIIAQPHETLGHFADWAEIPTRRLRKLNAISFGKVINVGQKIHVDFGRIDRDTFHQRRRQYHLDIQNLYLSQHKVDRVKEHILKKKQNIWTLCQRIYKIPLWLLKKYNTNKDLAKLTVGDSLRIPIVVKNN